MDTYYSITLIFKLWAERVLCFILLWGAPNVQQISLPLAFPFTWNHSLGFPQHFSQFLWYWAVLAIALCTAPLRHTHDTPETMHTIFFNNNLTPPHTPMSFWELLRKHSTKLFFLSKLGSERNIGPSLLHILPNTYLVRCSLPVRQMWTIYFSSH